MSYPYDLFISFKNSTEAGLTVDREVAGRFYETLSRGGFRVFFSNMVLPDKGIANYMLEIQNALEDSGAILVVFSRAEYISRGWVAQEWMTFLNLLMKDPGRRIYIYSIQDDIAGLPPFLRPYECFGDFDAAIAHLNNGLRQAGSARTEGIGKRDFLNAYWGLFGNTDVFEYMDKPMRDPFYNYAVYCLRATYIRTGDADAYIDGLERLAGEQSNPLAMYLLSRHYRGVRSLDLPLSRELAQRAHGSFRRKIENSARDGEVSLWILTDMAEYDGAFFMCDVIHDVLDAYEVKTDIRVLTPDAWEEARFEEHRRIVLFWSNVGMEVPRPFIQRLRENRERVLIGLNAFGETALRCNIRDCRLFENNTADITRICRLLLG